jgi:lysophospholipase L1-like esterase
MTLPGFHRPFGALVLLTLALAGSASRDVARAETAQPIQTAAAPSANPPAAQPVNPAPVQPANQPEQSAAPAASTTGTAASGNSANPPAQKTLTARAVDTVKQVAKSASDIFNRVPCSAPKGGVAPVGSLPHVAAKLVAGQPVVIVAFGSSSTQGWGSSSPDFSYPSRLLAQLKRQYPTADITVLNRGKGGEDAPEMMKRLQTAVLDANPDLVIWQVGTNAVIRGFDPADIEKQVEEGIARIQAAGSDVVLVDPQYSPRVNERPENAGRMVNLLHRVARLRHAGIFPRFEVMRDWHEKQELPVETFVIADGLHMNDWGYACFAQLLGDDIIRSVGQIKLGVAVPSEVLKYKPM